jgi:hypothetical protein
VRLRYRVVDHVREGEWVRLPMEQVQTDTYAVTVGADALVASLDPPALSVSSVLEYYVRAFDLEENLSESGMLTLTVAYCIY